MRTSKLVKLSLGIALFVGAVFLLVTYLRNPTIGSVMRSEKPDAPSSQQKQRDNAPELPKTLLPQKELPIPLLPEKPTPAPNPTKQTQSPVHNEHTLPTHKAEAEQNISTQKSHEEPPYETTTTGQKDTTSSRDDKEPAKHDNNATTTDEDQPEPSKDEENSPIRVTYGPNILREALLDAETNEALKEIGKKYGPNTEKALSDLLLSLLKKTTE